MLQHPYFCSDAVLEETLGTDDEWRVDCSYRTGVAVLLSYQSAQTGEMLRLRRSLNTLGLSTADGLQVCASGTPCLLSRCRGWQVPSGMDWRIWYFTKMANAGEPSHQDGVSHLGTAFISVSVSLLRAYSLPGICQVRPGVLPREPHF